MNTALHDSYINSNVMKYPITIPTLSFCITCKNRLHQIRETLRRNLDDNSLFSEWVEFVLVDFGSTDGLREWVVGNFQGELASGYLKYFHTDGLPFWHCSVAKNTSHLLAAGDILVNLDCDNFTGPNGGRFVIRHWLKHDGEKLVLHQFDGNYWRGIYGRLATDRESFMAVGGYDESLEAASWQDGDLLRRLEGYGARCIVDPHPRYNQTIPNDRNEILTYVNSPLSYDEMMAKNKAISEANLAAGNWTVNRGHEWGIRRNLTDWRGREINVTEL